MDLTPQTPAEGICKVGNDMYHVKCRCGSAEHDLMLEAEADDYGHSITVYAETSTPYWREVIPVSYSEPWLLLQTKYFINDWANRIRIAAAVIWSGRVKTEVTTILTPQQAVNVAGVLTQFVESGTQDKQ